jgi:hypothetical protein
LKEIYELGIVFRGFVLINHIFRDLPIHKETESEKDLRGAFISAINTFAQTAFNNTSLEYLESGSILFIFKLAEIHSRDSYLKEPIIMYGLVEKTKKNPEKLVKKFFETVSPILELFIQRYNSKDFTELRQFEPFKKEIGSFFE